MCEYLNNLFDMIRLWTVVINNEKDLRVIIKSFSVGKFSEISEVLIAFLDLSTQITSNTFPAKTHDHSITVILYDGNSIRIFDNRYNPKSVIKLIWDYTDL